MKAMRVSLLILIIIGLGLIATQSLWVPTLVNAILQYQKISIQAVATTTIPTLATPAKKKAAIMPVPQLSSSTAQVGDFTLVVNCKNNNPVSVEIRKNTAVIQNLTIDAAVTGIPECVKAESQDINFDGYPDFMVPTDDGSGGTSYGYWLFSTSTQQFSCPESNNNCALMNPTFDAASKTITSIDPTGAGSTNIKTYGVAGGKLVLLSNINNNY